MADTREQKITQYFSNIVVRTLAKDLESIRNSGGLISYANQPQPSLEAVAPVLPPELPQATPSAPADLSVLQPSLTPGPSVSETTLPSQPSSAPKAASNDRLLYSLLAAVGIILVASAGYWLIYPRLASRFARTSPTPSFSPSRLPTPSATQESFNIQLSQALPETVLALTEKTSAGLTEALTRDLVFPAATSTLRVYNVTDSQGKQLTAQELVNLIVPDALLSFKSSLAESYLVVSYYLGANEPFVGVIFSLKPENLSLAQTLMQNWESAGAEDYFTSLYTPYAFSKRKAASFQTITFNGVNFRVLTLNSDNPNLELVYGFQGRFLLIAANRKVVEALGTRL